MDAMIKMRSMLRATRDIILGQTAFRLPVISARIAPAIKIANRKTSII
jgi:hypothetical protein